MTEPMKSLARTRVQELVPYQSARRLGGGGDLWLNANESPFDNQYLALLTGLNRYPECQPQALLQAYAQYAKVEPEQLMISRGADEAIELLIRTFCQSGQDEILYFPPTYGMYQVCAYEAEVDAIDVPLTFEGQLDLPAIEAQLAHPQRRFKLIFICHPSNPLGQLTSLADIERLLTLTIDKALVVVDEAYIDFCQEASVTPLLAHFKHLVVLRTLSKAFALAGIRCGFALAAPKVIESMLKVIAPYPVPAPVADIAKLALSDKNLPIIAKQIERLMENRRFLEQALSALDGIEVRPSVTNFVLITHPNADALFQSAMERGILLRKTSVKNSVRISVGTREDCQRVVRLVRDFIQPHALNTITADEDLSSVTTSVCEQPTSHKETEND